MTEKWQNLLKTQSDNNIETPILTTSSNNIYTNNNITKNNDSLNTEKIINNNFSTKEIDNIDQVEDQLEDIGLLKAPDGGYGWVIVWASFMANMIVDGVIVSKQKIF